MLILDTYKETQMNGKDHLNGCQKDLIQAPHST